MDAVDAVDAGGQLSQGSKLPGSGRAPGGSGVGAPGLRGKKKNSNTYSKKEGLREAPGGSGRAPDKGNGGTGGSTLHHQVFKTLYKNPLGLILRLPS